MAKKITISEHHFAEYKRLVKERQQLEGKAAKIREVAEKRAKALEDRARSINAEANRHLAKVKV